MNVAPPRHTFRRPDHHRSADLHQPGRPIQFGTKNGYFVTAHITVKALSSYTVGFQIYSGDFCAIVKRETITKKAMATPLKAQESDSELETMTLNAGETGSRTLNFDLSARHGRIAYSPQLRR
jgi:hypothetical protein